MACICQVGTVHWSMLFDGRMFFHLCWTAPMQVRTPTLAAVLCATLCGPKHTLLS